MSATSGAVFFLGNRAHYQALQPPISNLDVENGNHESAEVTDFIDCSQVHSDRCERASDIIMKYCEDVSLENNGVTRRFRGRRYQDGSSEKILSDDADMEPMGFQDLSCSQESLKDKDAAMGRCAPIRAFIAGLRTKRSKRGDQQIQFGCAYTESCRCIECQSRYFEVDESEDGELSDRDDYFNFDCESAFDEFETYDDFETCDFETYDPEKRESFAERTGYEEEVFDSANDTASTDVLISPVASVTSEEEEDRLELELAAGTPVVLDYLLNHPITCAIQ